MGSSIHMRPLKGPSTVETPLFIEALHKAFNIQKTIRWAIENPWKDLLYIEGFWTTLTDSNFLQHLRNEPAFHYPPSEIKLQKHQNLKIILL